MFKNTVGNSCHNILGNESEKWFAYVKILEEPLKTVNIYPYLSAVLLNILLSTSFLLSAERFLIYKLIADDCLYITHFLMFMWIIVVKKFWGKMN